MAEAPVENAPGSRKVLADEIAAPFREEIRQAVATMGGVGPKLVGFLANSDPAAKKYAEWTGKAMTADNLQFELRQVQESNLEEELEKANKEQGVDGIMIYYPVFGQRPSFHGGSHDDYLRDTVSPYKDAEGLNHFYRRALYQNKRYVDSENTKKCVLPCTPLAVVKSLEHLKVYDPALPVGERMTGKTAVVVNRSEVVGRPVAAMLATQRVLEVGCGQGRILQELGRFLGEDWELMGMNLDGNQLRHAKERPVKVTKMDMNHMPYDWISNNSVDAAYNLGAITFQRDLEEHAQELARILKPGARFVVACDWTNFDDENGLNLQDPEHRRLWSAARRLGAAGRYCYSQEGYVNAFAKHNFKHVHSEVYGARYVQALRDINAVRIRAAEWMKFVGKADVFGVLSQALTMMERFGTDTEYALEAHDRKLFTYCASHVFELQR